MATSPNRITRSRSKSSPIIRKRLQVYRERDAGRFAAHTVIRRLQIDRAKKGE